MPSNIVLEWVAAADRCLVELTEDDRVVTLAREADDCFILKFYSFRRELMSEVFQHLRSGGVTTEPGEILDCDAAFFLFGICCDGRRHHTWHVWTRWGQECPPDLVEVAKALDG